ncbi:MAG TPA: RiPP maturation radical SAM C-methyltransferase [Rhizobiaceae bacterium]|nr:RiPP maturation radical SAM C-methyltransferase [Rhizobiaceae bacterium]
MLLVNMPFGPLHTPSLALSIIAPLLERDEITCRARYANVEFAEKLDYGLYNYISSGLPRAHDLVGEFIFSRALFGSASRSSESFLEYLEETFGDQRTQHYYAASEYLLQQLNVRIDDTRRVADEFIVELAGQIGTLAPKVVALTSAFQQNTASLGLARLLRERFPQIKIMIGGANCEGVMGRALFDRFSFLDCVCTGEAEPVVVDAVRHLLDPDAAPPRGAIYFRGVPDEPGPVPHKMFRDFGAVPAPAFDDFFSAVADRDLPEPPRLLFETSRGCWWGEKHHCTFCGLNGGTMTFRQKPADLAIRQLEELTRKYPGVTVCMTDNIMDNAYFRTFVPEIVNRGLKLDLFYELKANVKYEQLALLAEAGIKRIQPGIESFDDAVLGLMDKGITGLQNLQLLKWCRELGIDPAWNMLWGFPGEEPAAYEAMCSLIPRVTHFKPPSGVGRLRLDRFSPYFECHQDLFSDVRPFRSYALVYPLPEEDLRRIAYFFDGRVAGGDTVSSYTRGVFDAIMSWKDQSDSQFLFRADVDGVLTVFDTRSQFAPGGCRVRVFAGAERAILLACEGVTTREKLDAELAPSFDPEAVESALAALDLQGLVAVRSNRILALPVRMSVAYPGAAFLQDIKDARLAA